jgi:hypothetical protein
MESDNYIRPPQFSLRTLAIAMSAFAGGAGAVHWFGFRAVVFFSIAASILTVLMIAWSWVYLRAPQLTKYATAFGVMAFFTLSLLVSYLVQSREEARRLRLQTTLRDLWRISTPAEEYYPAHPENRFGGDHWRRLVQFEEEHGVAVPEHWDE